MASVAAAVGGRRHQAGAATGGMSVERYRYAIDRHSGVAFCIHAGLVALGRAKAAVALARDRDAH